MGNAQSPKSSTAFVGIARNYAAKPPVLMQVPNKHQNPTVKSFS